MSDAANAHADRSALTSRAAIASATMALFLAVIKTVAVARTGSVAMLGSLADTALDLVASLATLMGVRLAAQPADHDHRFGHGKAEALAALFQVFLIAISAIGILWRSAHQLMGKAVTSDAEFGIGVSVIAIVATIGLLAYQRMVIARTGSIAISTDNLHYKSDLMLNGAVIAALALEQYVGIGGADALFGVGIGLWLLWGAYQASNDAVDQLMDKEWPEEKRSRFLEVAASHPELAGIHDFRTRTSGTHDFVQFHVWVDPHMTVEEAHRVMDEVEERLLVEFPGVEILIHPDPEGHIEPHAEMTTEVVTRPVG